MAERPLLIFPSPVMANRRSVGGGRPKAFRKPSPEAQRDRIAPKMAELERIFARRQAELRGDPTGAEVEQVLVLETVGRVDDFVRAVRGLEGLEWMADLDVDNIAPDDDFYYEDDPEKPLTGRLYLIMSNQRGLRQLLDLWQLYRENPNNPSFARGRTKWRDLFSLLRDIRPWGPEDRLRETGLLQVWRERVAEGAERLSVEIELWPRQDPRQRQNALRVVGQAVEAVGGHVIAQAFVPEIHYHGVLAELPIKAVGSLLAMEETRLVKCDQVMFFRPAGQVVAPLPAEELLPGPDACPDWKEPEGQPVVALLDGYPLENHKLLAGRVVVDDPDGWAGDCPAADRRHGTAMASLILHGELDAKEPPLSRPIYVRPILKPVAGWPDSECVPESVLPVDLVHRAVRRIKEGEAGQPPVAPSVHIVNLSVCDRRHSFYRFPTPWARLLDFLAWRYQLLFIVSAGNYTDDIQLDVPRNEFGRLLADPSALERETLRAVARQARLRPLLSPADAINVLTVGAVHNDKSEARDIPLRIDPLRSSSLPSPINAQGPGFRRSVKPDFLHDGGRQTYRDKIGTEKATLTLCRAPAAPPGQRVAAPSKVAGDLTKTVYTCGTSNAAALTTRTAAQLYEMLVDLRQEPGGELLDDRYSAVLLKALLVHSASWGDAAELIDGVLDATDAYHRKLALTRMLGYGVIRPGRVFECTEQRATVIGAGELGSGQAHVYSLPLPPGLSGRTVWRRLIISLAWMTPINPVHRAYRKAALWVEPVDETGAVQDIERILGVRRREVHWQTARNGTLQHEVFEGDRATAFVDGYELRIKVNCRPDAGDFTENIPYGLVVTLEVAEGVDIPIYSQIRERIRPVVRVETHI